MILHTEDDYKTAMKLINIIFGVNHFSPFYNIYHDLIYAVGDYEEKHFNMEEPTPEAAAEFRREQEGWG